ncbi:MAG: HAD-IA family hydrolase [Actinobacteria bacterium]|nr:HAD-IA family hydrolase [Actinomycetota bacterium]
MRLWGLKHRCSTAQAEVKRRLCNVGLLERFDVVVGGYEVARGKPAFDLFLRAGEDLGVVAANCVVFEDPEACIRAAAAAGMIPVLVPDLVDPSPVARELGLPHLTLMDMALAIEPYFETVEIRADVFGHPPDAYFRAFVGVFRRRYAASIASAGRPRLSGRVKRTPPGAVGGPLIRRS